MEMIKKLNWRWLMMLAAVMMVGVTMTACGDDDDDDGGNPSEVVGLWASLDDIEDGYTMVEALELKCDGTGSFGIWDTNSQEYTVGLGDEDTPDYFTWSYDDGVMTAVAPNGEVARLNFYVSEDGKTAWSTNSEDDYVFNYIRVR